MFKSYRTYKLKDIQRAYHEGYLAFGGGGVPTWNPYTKRDEALRNQWFEGWNKAKSEWEKRKKDMESGNTAQ